MKIRILIKEKLDKIYNILPLIKKNKFLSKNIKNIEFFDENNWTKVFTKIAKEFEVQKKFDRLVIFDYDGMLPFIFFTKEKGFISSCPFNVSRSNLSRSHNNANCIIMSCKDVAFKDMNNILNEFFTVQHEGGRHATRVSIMQGPYKKTNTIHKFNKNLKNTIVVCSDHAGFNLKQQIKKYLTSNKKIKIIDVGCFSDESTHYPLFAIAMILNANKASMGIAFCSTGVGMANTTNRFKGINSIVCWNPNQAKLARSKYNTNVLVLGSTGLAIANAKKIADKFIKTPLGKSKFMLPMNKFGYAFDKKAFKKIKINKNIQVPKELK